MAATDADERGVADHDPMVLLTTITTQAADFSHQFAHGLITVSTNLEQLGLDTCRRPGGG